MLLRTPGFTIIPIISLALGIGANPALFTIADVELLKSLPVKEPERLVVLIACANVANLLLSRAAACQTEIGIRLALGADRRDLLKMVLREGMIVALLGVALGLIGAYWLTGSLESQIHLSQVLYGVKVFDPLTYGGDCDLVDRGGAQM